MNILIVIPARSGSKRLEHKNIKLLGAGSSNIKPLLCWSLDTALDAAIWWSNVNMDGEKIKTKIIVSTDSRHYQKIANRWNLGGYLQGAKPAPFIRHAAISEDVATGLVCRHAYKYAKDKMDFEADWVVTLQPTSPFRDRADLAEALQLAVQCNYMTVFSVRPTTEPTRWMIELHDSVDKTIENKATPYEGGTFEGLSGEIFQDQPKLYIPNGSVYVTRSDIIQKGQIYGDWAGCIIMEEPWKNVDIEEEINFKWAEFLLKEGYVK